MFLDSCEPTYEGLKEGVLLDPEPYAVVLRAYL